MRAVSSPPAQGYSPKRSSQRRSAHRTKGETEFELAGVVVVSRRSTLEDFGSSPEKPQHSTDVSPTRDASPPGLKHSPTRSSRRAKTAQPAVEHWRTNELFTHHDAPTEKQASIAHHRQARAARPASPQRLVSLQPGRLKLSPQAQTETHTPWSPESPTAPVSRPSKLLPRRQHLGSSLLDEYSQPHTTGAAQGTLWHPEVGARTVPGRAQSPLWRSAPFPAGFGLASAAASGAPTVAPLSPAPPPAVAAILAAAPARRGRATESPARRSGSLVPPLSPAPPPAIAAVLAAAAAVDPRPPITTQTHHSILSQSIDHLHLASTLHAPSARQAMHKRSMSLGLPYRGVMQPEKVLVPALATPLITTTTRRVTAGPVTQQGSVGNTSQLQAPQSILGGSRAGLAVAAAQLPAGAQPKQLQPPSSQPQLQLQLPSQQPGLQQAAATAAAPGEALQQPTAATMPPTEHQPQNTAALAHSTEAGLLDILGPSALDTADPAGPLDAQEGVPAPYSTPMWVSEGGAQPAATAAAAVLAAGPLATAGDIERLVGAGSEWVIPMALSSDDARCRLEQEAASTPASIARQSRPMVPAPTPTPAHPLLTTHTDILVSSAAQTLRHHMLANTPAWAHLVPSQAATEPHSHKQPMDVHTEPIAVATATYGVQTAGSAVAMDFMGAIETDMTVAAESRAVSPLRGATSSCGPVVVLTGLPGVGKSHATLRVAEAMCTGPTTATATTMGTVGVESGDAVEPVWRYCAYADLQSARTLDAACAAIATALGAGLPLAAAPAGWPAALGAWLRARHLQIMSRHAQWAAERQQGGCGPCVFKGWWGLCLDNADGVPCDVLSGLVQDILAACPSVQLLVTRQSWQRSATDALPWSGHTAHTCVLRAKPLARDAAWDVFRALIGTSSDAAMRLCQLCAGLPGPLLTLSELLLSAPCVYDCLDQLETLLSPAVATVVSRQRRTVEDLAAEWQAALQVMPQKVLPVSEAASLIRTTFINEALRSLPEQVLCGLEALSAFSGAWVDIDTVKRILEAPTASQVQMDGDGSSVLAQLTALHLLSYHPGSTQTFPTHLTKGPRDTLSQPGNEPWPAETEFVIPTTGTNHPTEGLQGWPQSVCALQQRVGASFCVPRAVREALCASAVPVKRAGKRRVIRTSGITDADSHTVTNEPSYDPPSTLSHDTLVSGRLEARTRGLCAALAGTDWLATSVGLVPTGTDTRQDVQGIAKTLLTAVQGYHTASHWQQAASSVTLALQHLQDALGLPHRAPDASTLRQLPHTALNHVADALWLGQDLIPRMLSAHAWCMLVKAVGTWAEAWGSTGDAHGAKGAVSAAARMNLLATLAEVRAEHAARARDAAREVVVDSMVSVAAGGAGAGATATAVETALYDAQGAIRSAVSRHAQRERARADGADLARLRLQSRLDEVETALGMLIRAHGHAHPHTLHALMIQAEVQLCYVDTQPSMSPVPTTSNTSGTNTSTIIASTGNVCMVDAARLARKVLDTCEERVRAGVKRMAGARGAMPPALARVTARAHEVLAGIWESMGAYSQAEEHWHACDQSWTQALSSPHQAPNTEGATVMHPERVRVLQQLARCYCARGDWAKARHATAAVHKTLSVGVYGYSHEATQEVALDAASALLCIPPPSTPHCSDASETPTVSDEALMEASHLLDQAQLALQAAEGSASHSGVAGSQRARVLRLQSAVLRLAGKRTEALRRLDAAIECLRRSTNTRSTQTNNEATDMPSLVPNTGSDLLGYEGQAAGRDGMCDEDVTLLVCLLEERAALLRELGQSKTACKAYGDAYSLRLNINGPHHPATLHTLLSWSSLYSCDLGATKHAHQLIAWVLQLVQRQHSLLATFNSALDGSAQTNTAGVLNGPAQGGASTSGASDASTETTSTDTTQSAEEEAGARSSQAPQGDAAASAAPPPPPAWLLECVGVRAAAHGALARALAAERLWPAAVDHAQSAEGLYDSLLLSATTMTPSHAPAVVGAEDLGVAEQVVPISTAGWLARAKAKTALHLATCLESQGRVADACDAYGAAHALAAACGGNGAAAALVARAVLGQARCNMLACEPAATHEARGTLQQCVDELLLACEGQANHAAARQVQGSDGASQDSTAEEQQPMLQGVLSHCRQERLADGWLAVGTLFEEMSRFWAFADQHDFARHAATAALHYCQHSVSLRTHTHNTPPTQANPSTLIKPTTPTAGTLVQALLWPENGQLGFSTDEKVPKSRTGLLGGATESVQVLCEVAGVDTCARVVAVYVTVSDALALCGEAREAVRHLRCALEWCGAGVKGTQQSQPPTPAVARLQAKLAMLLKDIDHEGVQESVRLLDQCIPALMSACGKEDDQVPALCVELGEALALPAISPFFAPNDTHSSNADTTDTANDDTTESPEETSKGDEGDVSRARSMLCAAVTSLQARHGPQDPRVLKALLTLSSLELHWHRALHTSEALARCALQRLTALAARIGLPVATDQGGRELLVQAIALPATNTHNPTPTPAASTTPRVPPLQLGSLHNSVRQIGSGRTLQEPNSSRGEMSGSHNAGMSGGMSSQRPRPASTPITPRSYNNTRLGTSPNTAREPPVSARAPRLRDSPAAAVGASILARANEVLRHTPLAAVSVAQEEPTPHTDGGALGAGRRRAAAVAFCAGAGVAPGEPVASLLSHRTDTHSTLSDLATARRVFGPEAEGVAHVVQPAISTSTQCTPRTMAMQPMSGLATVDSRRPGPALHEARPEEHAMKPSLSRAQQELLLTMAGAHMQLGLVRERMGRIRAAEDSHREALRLFHTVFPALHEALDVAHERDILQHTGLDSRTAWQIAQALAGLARVILGAARVVPGAETTTLDPAALQDLAGGQVHTNCPTCPAQGSGTTHYSSLLGERPAGTEAITLNALLVCAPGSAGHAAASGCARECVRLLKGALALLESCDDMAHEYKLIQGASLRCDLSIALCALGSTEALHLAESLARRAVGALESAHTHKAWSFGRLCEADAQLVLSAVLTATCQHYQRSLDALTTTTTDTNTAITATHTAATDDAAAAQQEPSLAAPAQGSDSTAAADSSLPRSHTQALAYVSGLPAAPQCDADAIACNQGDAGGTSSTAGLQHGVGVGERTPRDVSGRLSLNLGGRVGRVSIDQVTTPRSVASRNGDAGLVVIMSAGRGGGGQPSAARATAAAADAKARAAVDAARRAQVLLSGGDVAAAAAIPATPTAALITAVAHHAHVRSCCLAHDPDTWEETELLYQIALQHMSSFHTQGLLAAPVLDLLTDAAAAALAAGHPATAAAWVGAHIAAAERARTVAPKSGCEREAAMGQLTALHARVLHFSHGAVAPGADTLQDVSLEEIPRKRGWFSRVLDKVVPGRRASNPGHTATNTATATRSGGSTTGALVRRLFSVNNSTTRRGTGHARSYSAAAPAAGAGALQPQSLLDLVGGND